MTDIIGQTIAERYQFVERLGEGTFAQVYRVHDTRRNVDLAAKVLRVDIAHEPTFLERFRREGDVLARLQHPHIVRYYDLIETDEATFILMDYIPGETLQSTLYKLGRPLLVREAFEFLKPLTAALHFAHGEGVIHRDLKPGNILINENGNLFVTDFGIARLLDDATFISSLGQALGTPLYMAPEQITNDEISPATDVYSLGIILYQMLTATVPFSGKHPSATGATTSERITYEHLYVPPPPLQMFSENLPQAVDEVVICCLAKKPFARPASVREVYDMLAEAIGAAPSDLSPLPARSGDPPEEARLPEVSQFVNFRASMAEGDHPEATPEPEDDTPAEVTLPGTGELRAAAGNSSAQQVAVDDRPTHSKNPFRAKTIESSKPENQRTLTSRGSPRPATSEALPSPAESLPSASRQSIHGRRDVVILLLLGIIA
ncbi:MAG: serine/threonine protein kinase, partial [Chloroflexi bacterium]|nr:serine/threonine protein kinase [Chloroflexota bacterium]